MAGRVTRLTGSEQRERGAPPPPAPDRRRNLLALIGDFLFFGMGLGFASQTTVVPSFVLSLTSFAPLVGLGSSLSSGGWLMPQLFAANLLAGRARKKSAVIAAAAASRTCFLGAALVVLLLGGRSPVATLVLFYTLFFLFWALDGVASVAWLDIVGKVLAARDRARMTGIGQAAGGVMGIGAGLVVTAVLSSSRLRFPVNYGLLFLLGVVPLCLSLASFSFLREHSEPASGGPLPWSAHFRRIGGLLRDDGTFRRLLATQLALASAGLATPFYVVFGLERLGFAPGAIGIFTSFQVGGSILGALAMQLLGEHRGSRSVMRLWGCLAAATPVLALGISMLAGRGAGPALLWGYAAVFSLVGAQANANMAGFTNYVLEHAPAAERPLYVGSANTLSGAALAMPLIGGAIASIAGYPALFVVAIAGPLAGLALSLRLPEPRARAGSSAPAALG